MNLKNLVTFAVVTLFGFAFSSCNTFLGFGRDLQQAGHGIENTVYGNKDEPAIPAPSNQGTQY